MMPRKREKKRLPKKAPFVIFYTSADELVAENVMHNIYMHLAGKFSAMRFDAYCGELSCYENQFHRLVREADILVIKYDQKINKKWEQKFFKHVRNARATNPEIKIFVFKGAKIKISGAEEISAVEEIIF